jgi:hypothetical protein
VVLLPKKDKINELQKTGMLLVYDQSVANGEKIQTLINRLIDWLLFNLDEIKKYIKEMDYLGATTVFGAFGGNDEPDIMEKNIISLEDAKKLIQSVENTISKFDEQEFDVYIGRYHNKMIYNRIAEYEDISEITVKRTVKRIRQDVADGFDNDDVTLDNVLSLRRKLSYISLKKVS